MIPFLETAQENDGRKSCCDGIKRSTAWVDRDRNFTLPFSLCQDIAMVKGMYESLTRTPGDWGTSASF
jgi:hypothetical protein